MNVTLYHFKMDINGVKERLYEPNLFPSIENLGDWHTVSFIIIYPPLIFLSFSRILEVGVLLPAVYGGDKNWNV